MRMLALMVLAVVVPAPLHSVTSLKPDLVVAAASAVQTCVGQSRSYDVSVTVVNRGGIASPARLDAPVVAVQDSSQPARWSGSVGLPALAVNASVTVVVRLAPARTGVATVPVMPLSITLNRGRLIDESNFDNNDGRVAAVTSSGCVAVTPATLGVNASNAHIISGFHLPPNTVVLIPTPRPEPRIKPVPPNFIAPPSGLTYTTDPTVCVNHVGLLGAFVCEQAISQVGLLLLVWSWTPCNNPTCVQQIQGYHIYNAPLLPPHLKLRDTPTPLDTQTDPTVTMRGLSPYHKGQCFVVTAYGNGHESDDSNTFCVGASVFITAPWNVRYAPVNYHLLLEWYWTPCPASNGCVQSVDGFNVYQTGGAFVTQQTDPSRPAADLGPFQVGSCYVVRAYRSNIQSDPSSPFCVVPQMVPTPVPPPDVTTPRPSAPMHVDIDITDDSFPSNTIVKVGGSVTWKNDDTDAHDVISDDSEIVGGLLPGETFTYTFTRVAVTNYHCDYHQGMHGTITVVAH